MGQPPAGCGSVQLPDSDCILYGIVTLRAMGAGGSADVSAGGSLQPGVDAKCGLPRPG